LFAKNGRDIQGNQSDCIVDSTLEARGVLLQWNDPNLGVRERIDDGSDNTWQVSKKLTSADINSTLNSSELNVSLGSRASGSQSNGGSRATNGGSGEGSSGISINHDKVQVDSAILWAVEGGFVFILTANSINAARSAIEGAIASGFSFRDITDSVTAGGAGRADTAIPGAGSAVLHGKFTSSISATGCS